LYSRPDSRPDTCLCVCRQYVCLYRSNIVDTGYVTAHIIVATCKIVDKLCDMFAEIAAAGFFEQGGDTCDERADRAAKLQAAGDARAGADVVAVDGTVQG
jgi:hypothetical protein